MPSIIQPMLGRLLLLACLCWSGVAGADEASAGGVAFHLDSDAHMNRALRQIARQHDYMPDTEIRVILIASAVDAAVDGATDPNGGLYSAQLEQLLAAGIRVFACETTMIAANISEDDLAFGIETVPSGIVELTKLQLTHHYAYQKI